MPAIRLGWPQLDDLILILLVLPSLPSILDTFLTRHPSTANAKHNNCQSNRSNCYSHPFSLAESCAKIKEDESFKTHGFEKVVVAAFCVWRQLKSACLKIDPMTTMAQVCPAEAY